MSVIAVVGAQWGDEGKGRLVDNLAKEADIVCRFQGGDNAGHTVVNEYGRHALHIIPCGIFYPSVDNIIGAGCVVNPGGMLTELVALEEAGVNTKRLWISSRAQMIMPYHRTLDALEEAARGKNTIGTTKRGVGPAYADKAARSGLRIGDLLQKDWLETRVEASLANVNRKMSLLGGEPVDKDETLALCRQYTEKMGHRIIDTVPMTRQAIESGKNILLEGQLGIMRDLDWGIYPYVTSSNPTAAYASAGIGIPARSLDTIIGVVKAYSSAVGDGPFPIELFGDEAERLRELGNEYGATTGRPRRCGWFDGVAIRYAAWVNGMTGLAITKLDVLDSYESLKICVGYQMPNGDVITDSMPDTPQLYDVTPVYEEWEGWNAPTTECRHWDALPPQAQAYINRLSELAGVKVDYVSVGPERDQMFTV
ncbi:MAG: adenylosuccinate synthase [Chloroflexota bacterium]